MVENAGNGRGPTPFPGKMYCWFRLNSRGRWVPLEPAYAISSTVPPPNSRSMVVLHDCRYCVGLVSGRPLVLVTPELLALASGNGFETVSARGLLDVAENVSVFTNGNVSLKPS